MGESIWFIQNNDRRSILIEIKLNVRKEIDIKDP